MPTKRAVRRTTRILVLNPNSSQEMTHTLQQSIRSMELSSSTEVDAYTAPQKSPTSINNGEDVEVSARVVEDDLTKTQLLQQYDAILVACFSAHPLVGWLAEQDGEFARLSVMGIFEASILTALSLIRPGKKWGIVTTGKYWEQHLVEGAKRFLGTFGDQAKNDRFAGVETTGLNASDFHDGVDPEVVRQALQNATARLLTDKDVECVIMGCAGMTGLEKVIRSTAAELCGPEQAADLFVVDGVRAGIGLLEQMVRNRRAFQRPP
ncbi:hypothetical protein VTJ83DRAFT_4103 [Remersonia thermophila]|uniref:Hydantoin racemase n=1 Tax=Remersonia thermophila TaxID=72144 RepID=A0ABR4DFY4_9PEZI